ncbi:conserved region of Rad21 / Rec8 like protein [Haematococcus lacustris]|uniref:Conserved region of Rad21 / Rec8 like protein n=1 Tax=Haematococcus lacustris TaxID=44745 RepID=A0A6A0AEK0_HAELA|nr:conserved region of Rad21 / Rec8 like protein [Haematococcus lacustris]
MVAWAEQPGSSGLLAAGLASGQGEGQGALKPALALAQLLCRASRLEAARTFSDAVVLQGQGLAHLKQQGPYCPLYLHPNPTLLAQVG